MNLRSIFSGNGTDRLRVPEIEVQGDRLTVHGNEGQLHPAPEGEEQETSIYRLPKTKWFAR